jgi:hypothetical protein
MGMEYQVDDGTSNLLRDARLDFDRHVGSHDTIDPREPA